MKTFPVLPAGASINPAHPAPGVNPDLTAYVLFKTSEERTRPTRVLTSFGSLRLDLNQEIELRHDQNGSRLGTYRVAGIHDFRSGICVGLVPNIKIKHCVAK